MDIPTPTQTVFPVADAAPAGHAAAPTAVCQVYVQVLDARVHTWKLPAYHSDMAAAMDLYACIDAPITLAPGAVSLIPTGIAICMGRSDMAALIFPRSGAGHKRGLVMGNGTGVIDADYNGQLFVSACNRNPRRLRPWKQTHVVIEPGERIAQLMFIPILRAQLSVVEAFPTTTQRGAGGFGSTGAIHTPQRHM